MARRGQVGMIVTHGKWYVVRFWKYPADGDRIRASVRICPVSGPGYMAKGERRRRANEIIEASGVNDVQQFNDNNVGISFRAQARLFLDGAAKRKRRPIKPATLQTWEYYLNKWLLPYLGDLPLAMVNNATVKPLVTEMHDKGLAPHTIQCHVSLIKLIVASAVDKDGEQMFPRRWNHDFLDLPVAGDQHRPTFTPEIVTKLLEVSGPRERALFALLAGGGLRIGEALGLEVRHLSADCRTVTIEQSLWNGRVQAPKTRSAYRQVDMSPALADMLREFLGDRREGFVFRTRGGGPIVDRSSLSRWALHSVLNGMNVPTRGFHAFRRFRATWLRKQRVPEDLIRFWLGHSGRTVTDSYSRLGEDKEFRLSVAETAGLGFDLPVLMGPMGPKNEEGGAVENAPEVFDSADVEGGAGTR